MMKEETTILKDVDKEEDIDEEEDVDKKEDVDMDKLDQ